MRCFFAVLIMLFSSTVGATQDQPKEFVSTSPTYVGPDSEITIRLRPAGLNGFRIIRPNGERLYIIHDKDGPAKNSPIKKIEAYMRYPVSAFRGLIYRDGEAFYEQAFTIKGTYILYFAENLGTELENTEYSDFKVHYDPDREPAGRSFWENYGVFPFNGGPDTKVELRFFDQSPVELAVVRPDWTHVFLISPAIDAELLSIKQITNPMLLSIINLEGYWVKDGKLQKGKAFQDPGRYFFYFSAKTSTNPLSPDFDRRRDVPDIPVGAFEFYFDPDHKGQ